MILSRKLATSVAFFMSLAASSSSTVISSTEGTTKGLSLSEYDSLVFTDIRKELGASLSDDDAERLWREATANEWRLSEDNQTAFGLRNSDAYPYVVCQKDPKSGYEFKQTVMSEFDESIENIINVYNDKDMACVMIRASQSVARRVAASSSSLLIQPLFPAMKIAKGVVDSIVDNEDEVSVQLSALLCPGGSSVGSETNAAKLGRTIVDAIRRNNDDFSDEEKEEEVVSVMTRRFLRVSEEHDNERSELWKAAFADSATADHNCDGMFSKILTLGGYKGESFSVGQPFKDGETTKDDISAPIEASPSCLLSLVAGIAASPDVCFVEIVPEMKLRNAESQWIIQSKVEDERPWFDAGLDGTGQTVAVSDTGLDMESCYFLDGTGNVDRDGTIESDARKVVQYYPFADAVELVGGHGTHVAGTVAGRKATNGVDESTGLADGVAREAKIVMMDIGVATELIFPSNLERLLGPGQNAGARIHSASWGGISSGYDSWARDFDQFTVDNPDFLSVVAAGNFGGIPGKYDIPGTVGTPATAKNIISVGATESYGSELTSPGMKGFEYLAYFSSRGPTKDGRTKPDVVAPGYDIRSAKSSGKNEKYSCDPLGLMYMAGTSMAAPAVSGTAAMVRQYFVEGWYPSGTPNASDSIMPSAALVKAVLLNGAQYLLGVSNQGRVSQVTPYDNNQNFGRISLIDSLKLKGKNNMNIFVEEGTVGGFKSQVESKSTVVNTSSCSSKIVDVTLVWTDPVGFTNCKKCLMNDLDLVVMKNGQRMYPNGKRSVDTINNNERVRMDVGDGDQMSVTVSASNLITAEQDYALVMTGCF